MSAQLLFGCCAGAGSRDGAPKRPEGWGPEGWEPKLSRFFPLPPQFSFFLGGLHVEFWWCLNWWCPKMSTFGVLGLSCEAPAAPKLLLCVVCCCVLLCCCVVVVLFVLLHRVDAVTSSGECPKTIAVPVVERIPVSCAKSASTKQSAVVGSSWYPKHQTSLRCCWR